MSGYWTNVNFCYGLKSISLRYFFPPKLYHSGSHPAYTSIVRGRSRSCRHPWTLCRCWVCCTPFNSIRWTGRPSLCRCHLGIDILPGPARGSRTRIPVQPNRPDSWLPKRRRRNGMPASAGPGHSPGSEHRGTVSWPVWESPILLDPVYRRRPDPHCTLHSV